MKEIFTEKQMKKIHKWLRAAIQLFFFLFFPSAFTASFAGVKYIASRLGSGVRVEWTAFVAALAGLCLFTMVFGRFFCGFACAFGSLGDAVRAAYVWCCRKWKKKPVSLPSGWCRKLSCVKYAVLLLIVLLCFTGIYGNLKGISPWDVFSMLHAGNVRISGHLTGALLLLLIFVGMCLQERFFCRFLCPMGAVFSLLPIFPVFALRRKREDCIAGCSACTKLCPSDVELAGEGSLETAGDCFLCQKCIDTCPRKHIHCGFGRLRGNEIWFTLLRGVGLVVLYRLLGI